MQEMAIDSILESCAVYMQYYLYCICILIKYKFYTLCSIPISKSVGAVNAVSAAYANSMPTTMNETRIKSN